jgi:hypothetical protein
MRPAWSRRPTQQRAVYQHFATYDARHGVEKPAGLGAPTREVAIGTFGEAANQRWRALQHDLQRLRGRCGSEHVVGCIASPIGKRWVAITVGSSLPPAISESS